MRGRRSNLGPGTHALAPRTASARPRFGIGLMVLAGLISSVAGRAHDLFEIWTIAMVRPDYFEVAITMAKGTALKLVDPKAELPELTVENFATHRSAFDRIAPELIVPSAAKKPLALIRLETQLTEEGDVVFHYAFAAPPAGRLLIEAAFLKKLGSGYGGILEVSDTAGHTLGWEQVSPEKPSLEITVPPAKR